MTKPTPTIYLLHGDDEFAIARFVADLQAKIGDPALVSMNLTVLDGRSADLVDWFSIASTLPFLADRRMVILSNYVSRLGSPTARQKFLTQLEKIQSTTALLLVEHSILLEERGTKGDTKPHWLLAWADKNGEKVWVHVFPQPKGDAMVRWILDRARALGGQLTPKAAMLLAAYVGDDPRLADQEIQKALTYVNFKHPVEPDDIELLTPDTNQGDMFSMVDAMAARDERKALDMLHRQLAVQEAISIFGMVVRQFRLLLLAREIHDNGGREQQVVVQLKRFKVSSYPAKKAYQQAQRFTLPQLEMVYHCLLDLDEAIKTGQVPGDLALEIFLVSFTSQSEPSFRNLSWERR